MPNNQFGDFQTPHDLAYDCLKLINIPSDARVFEPTCGTGSFLKAAAEIAPLTERKGIELNPDYASQATDFADITCADIFTYDFSELKWNRPSELFVIGNPPWVTASELKRMGSSNIPKKSNFKGVSGLDAIMGSSNFDICEFIILEMLSSLQEERLTLGMLCKTQVARNVIEYMSKNKLVFAEAAIYRIDAKKWFGAAVDACWFVLKRDSNRKPSNSCNDFASLYAEAPLCTFGYVDNRLVSNLEKYAFSKSVSGLSPVTWRSGLKHDASKVFELAEDENGIHSSFGDTFDQSLHCLYPLMKSSDVAHGRRESGKWVIVPQKALDVDPATLQTTAPEVWDYLVSHGDLLDGRSSSIYQKKFRFAVFGLGDYTFKPYKVAISGLYKQAKFQLIAPVHNKPVIFDDTCYFIGFDDAEEAAIAWALLSSEPCMKLIESLCFPDSKRPVTKRLLQHIDFHKAAGPENLPDVAIAESKRLGIKVNTKKIRSLYTSICAPQSLF